MQERKTRVGEAALLRLLRTIAEVKAAEGRWPYTRELLEHLRTWGYGQDVLEEAVRRGLVERYEGKCSSRRPCVFNRLTEKGEAVLKLMG
jgi:DNA-binding MarR family transcriptional regulator